MRIHCCLYMFIAGSVRLQGSRVFCSRLFLSYKSPLGTMTEKVMLQRMTPPKRRS